MFIISFIIKSLSCINITSKGINREFVKWSLFDKIGDFLDGVWIAEPKVALPVALSLRQSLIEISAARQATQGQQTKMEMVYSYLTGSRFRQRVQALVEAFSSMKEDLDREKKTITRQWAKREEQIDRVMQATVGMYGDLQGIAGKTLQEIEGLEFQGMLDFKDDE